jgi:hypothetical protein
MTPVVVVCRATAFESLSTGVGQFYINAPAYSSMLCRPQSYHAAASGDEPSSCALAVGQNEDPLALMRRSDIRCSLRIPDRIVPEPGKLSKYGSS